MPSFLAVRMTRHAISPLDQQLIVNVKQQEQTKLPVCDENFVKVGLACNPGQPFPFRVKISSTSSVTNSPWLSVA